MNQGQRQQKERKGGWSRQEKDKERKKDRRLWAKKKQETSTGEHYVVSDGI